METWHYAKIVIQGDINDDDVENANIGDRVIIYSFWK